MRRSLLFALILFGILAIWPAPTPQAHAQRDQSWEDGCDERILDTLANTTTLIDYRSACATYRECDPSGDGNAICQFKAFQQMLAQCTPGDQQCHDGAILFAAAMLVFDNPTGEWIDYVPPQTVIDGVPQALTAFWNGDDAGALAAYELTPPEDHQLDIQLPISRAVIHQRLNQPEEALSEYGTVFSYAFTDPLAHYARSQLYADLGRLDEASFDVEALARFQMDTPAVVAFVADLQAQYPLDNTKMQDWLLYPVWAGSFYVVDDIRDISLSDPRPVQIGIYDDLNLMVAIGLKNWNSDGLDKPHDLVQILHKTDDGGYFLRYPEYWDNGGSLSVTSTDDGSWLGHEGIYYFEGAGEWEFMLAPADAPDPRLALSDKRYCEGGVLSRLSIGAVVTGIDYSDRFPLEMTDSPGGAVIDDIKVPYEGYITVIGGPECVGSVVWWEGIHSDGTRGWFGEEIDRLYYAQPVTMRPEPPAPFCAGQLPSLAPRLTVGTAATVLPGLGPNNLRSEPSVGADSVGMIPPDASFAVMGGPVCVDDTVWWYADYEGVQGWTAEGQAPDYWLAPMTE